MQHIFKTLDLKPSVFIQGNGTSIWAQSDEQYEVNRIEITYCEKYHTDKQVEKWGHLQLIGPNTNCNHCTDKQIEKQVKARILKIINDKLKLTILKINWSEQTMQPQNGWDFDIWLE